MGLWETQLQLHSTPFDAISPDLGPVWTSLSKTVNIMEIGWTVIENKTCGRLEVDDDVISGQYVKTVRNKLQLNVDVTSSSSFREGHSKSQAWQRVGRPNWASRSRSVSKMSKLHRGDLKGPETLHLSSIWNRTRCSEYVQHYVGVSYRRWSCGLGFKVHPGQKSSNHAVHLQGKMNW